MCNETDFSKAQVGDRMWSVRKGWGIIKSITYPGAYPIHVVFLDIDDFETFTVKGFYNERDKHPTLFWDEVKITPPPRPKRKVMKKGYVTPDAIHTHSGTCCAIVGCIEVTYEVEE